MAFSCGVGGVLSRKMEQLFFRGMECAGVLCTIWPVAGWCFGFVCSEFLWVKEGKRISGVIGFKKVQTCSGGESLLSRLSIVKKL